MFHEDRLIFDNVVPLAPIRYSLDLYIPTDWKFNIANPLHANNLLKPERVNKLGYHDPYYDQDTGRCSDWITYDEKENAFFCPLEFSPENWNFRQTIENDIRNNKADELSPLVGLNSDWSQTYRNYDQYRYLHSILWKDNQHFIAKLSDKMLNIFLEIEATVNGKGEINYTKNTVKEVEQKGEMTAERMKFYDGWENLKDFDIIIKDDITDTEYVTKKEFDELVEKYSRCSQ